MNNKQLLKIENPARYIGGEFGTVDVSTKKNIKLKVALCFPDTYEIGMSNNAVKILYDILNKNENIVAERIFMPYPDYANYLLENKLDLCSLESQTPIKDFDILSITISSELCFTTILKILELSNIEIFNENRKDDAPLVIAGGPAITNPIPMQNYIDFFCVGEFEPLKDFFYNDIVNFTSKEDLKNKFYNNKHYWTKGKDNAIRSINLDFKNIDYKYYPIPSIRTSQDHGAVEIMRGCPNGCRFCHAGIFYKPQREKNIDEIIAEIDFLVFKSGYRDISLTSLSSGDYSKIEELVDTVYTRYKDYNISFSLPSIKINSFTLNLLEKISNIKKSGLTLAIETACSESQISINKNINFEKLYAIIDEAKKLGWRIIKLYFMIGLPHYIDTPEIERDSIIETIEKIFNYSKLNLNINIGTFIPKPHTPFQYSKQLDFDIAQSMLTDIKTYFEKNKKIKISYHSPFISYIESFLTNGNENIGKVIYEAYSNGAYLDAWSEYFKIDVWKKVILNNKSIIDDCIINKTKMPWKVINLLTSENYLKNEFEKSKKLELTEKCDVNCNHLCGVCNKNDKVKLASKESNLINIQKKDSVDYQYVVLKFSRKNGAALISHRNLIPLIERIFFRANVNIKFSEGFNKKPKMDFANPLSVGIETLADYLMVAVDKSLKKEFILESLNSASILDFKWLDLVYLNINKGDKINSLMALYSSSDFLIKNFKLTDNNELVKIKEINDDSVLINIKNYKDLQLDISNCEITRVETYFEYKGIENNYTNFDTIYK